MEEKESRTVEVETENDELSKVVDEVDEYVEVEGRVFCMRIDMREMVRQDDGMENDVRGVVDGVDRMVLDESLDIIKNVRIMISKNGDVKNDSFLNINVSEMMLNIVDDKKMLDSCTEFDDEGTDMDEELMMREMMLKFEEKIDDRKLEELEISDGNMEKSSDLSTVVEEDLMMRECMMKYETNMRDENLNGKLQIKESTPLDSETYRLHGEDTGQDSIAKPQVGSCTPSPCSRINEAEIDDEIGMRKAEVDDDDVVSFGREISEEEGIITGEIERRVEILRIGGNFEADRKVAENDDEKINLRMMKMSLERRMEEDEVEMDVVMNDLDERVFVDDDKVQIGHDEDDGRGEIKFGLEGCDVNYETTCEAQKLRKKRKRVKGHMRKIGAKIYVVDEHREYEKMFDNEDKNVKKTEEQGIRKEQREEVCENDDEKKLRRVYEEKVDEEKEKEETTKKSREIEVN